MKLFFVRHGESTANILQEFSNTGWKHGLSEKGIQQAHALAAKFQGMAVSRIYTSPLQRAVQTAALLSETTGAAYAITDSLREFDTGITEGKSDPASWGLWKKVMYDWNQQGLWDERIEGGESFNDIRARFLPFLSRVLAEPPSRQGDLILVGHGGIFYCMLPLVLKNVIRSEIDQWGFPNTGTVLAEARSQGLFCLEWCGNRIEKFS